MFASLNTFLTIPVGGSSGYWLGVFSDSSNGTIANSVAIDSLGNMHVVGATQSGTIPSWQLIKLNNAGVIQWQRSLGNGSTSCNALGVALDPSNNVYVCGALQNAAETAGVAKYNSSGVLQWKAGLDTSGSDITYSIAYDSYNTTLYCSGIESSSGQQSLLFQINSSGSVLWKNRYSVGSFTALKSVSASTGGYCNAVGYSYQSGDYRIIFLQTDSNGNTQWQRELNNSSSNDQGNAIALDSSNNLYITGTNGNTNAENIYLVKYDSAGNFVWQRTLTSSGSIVDSGRGIAIDSSNNVYIIGYSQDVGTPPYAATLFLAKYNSSGVIQWQRTITTSNFGMYGESIKVDSLNNMYICGVTNAGPNSNAFIARLPSDGSLTGTYSVGGYSYTYAASSYTDSAASLSGGGGFLTKTTSSATAYTPTETDAVTTGTATITNI